MAQLASFRKGWENENLARFILSRFSFVAQPSTVSDDIGSDFFCTLFQIQKEGNVSYLMPRNSFAIQIKSNMDKLDVSNKLQYLRDLEIPFFVGVVDRQDLKLTIYSGEYMPAFFSYKGSIEKLQIELCEHVDFRKYFAESGTNDYILKFPKVSEMNVDATPEELERKVQTLCEVCTLINRNISSCKSGEYILIFKQGDDYRHKIFAGSGSAKVFRRNFIERFAEVFHNLLWIFQNDRSSFDIEEFGLFENLLHQMGDLYEEELPQYLVAPFLSLKARLEEDQKPA